MQDVVIIAAFFVMVLSPCVVAIYSFRARESDEGTARSTPATQPPAPRAVSAAKHLPV